MTDDELREMINRADVDGDGEERATRCPSPRRAPGSAARAFLAQVSREEFVRIMTYKVQAVATRCAWLGIHRNTSQASAVPTPNPSPGLRLYQDAEHDRPPCPDEHPNDTVVARRSFVLSF